MIAKSPKPSLAMFFSLTACVLLAACVPSFSADQPVAASSSASSTAQNSAKSTDAAAQRARVAFGNLPVTFEPNQGQADAAVKYMTHWHGYNLFLTSKEAVFTMPLASQNSALLDLSKRKENSASGVSKSGSSLDSFPNAESVIRMTMPGANQQPVITSEDQQPGLKNYFIGNDPKNWHTNIPAFARVRYHDVYPGVDAVYHGTRQLEFDLVVGAGANPDKIKLSFDGAQRVSTDDAGNLILTSEAGELRLQHPVSYQEKDGTRTEVDSRFVVKNDHEVVFALGSYDRSRELVIDPSISFATYFGGGGVKGSGEETGLGVAVDMTGNIYVVGTTNSPTLPGNPKTLPPAGGFDCYVVEFNPSGAIVFTTIFGGTDDDFPQAVAVDSTGIYVTGETQSGDFPVTTGAAQTTFGGAGPHGNGDAFVAKLASDGSTITWATFLGGTDFDEAFALAVDSSQNVFVAGETFSTTPSFPVVNPLPQGSTNNGMADGFVTEVKADGSAFLMSSFIGGINVDFATGVAWNSATGNVYVSGGTQSPDLPFTAGAFQQQCGTGPLKNCNETSKGAFLDDAFVAAFDPTSTSTYVYLTYLGGGSIDDALAIATDSTGNAYVTGKTASGASTPFPVLFPYQAVLNGSQNAFVTELNPTGTALVYSTYLGGNAFDKGLGIAVDTHNNAYVTGQTTSTSLFPTTNPTQLAFGGGNSGQFDSDAFLSQLNWNGTTLTLPFSTYIGGAGDEDILGGFVALDSTGENIFVVGDTNSINFPIQASGGKIADSSLNGGLGLAPICTVLNRQTGQQVMVVCPDAFVDLFTANTSGILVTLAGTGTGTVTSSPTGISCPGVGTCSASFPNPTQVTLTATPNANSSFTPGWSGGGCSGTGTCVINLTNLNEFVTATFTQVAANLSVTVVGTGSVTSTPPGISCPGTCTAPFQLGTKVTLTETPGTNFTFSGWSGGCTGTGTCAITLTKDEAVTATFEPNLSVTVVGPGTVTSSPSGINCTTGMCSASFPIGTPVTLTATAGTNFTFTGWSGGGCSGTKPCVVTLNSPQSVTATFEPALSVTVVGTGTVTSNSGGINCTTGTKGTCSASFPVGTKVTLTASAGPNSAFTAWTGGGCTGTGSCSITLSANAAVTATFTAVAPSLSVTVVGTGTVTSNSGGINCTTGTKGTCSASFPVGTKVTLTASAGPNSAFTAWTGGGCTGTGSCSITLSANAAVTATFQGFTIAASALSPSSVSPGGSATSTVTITPSGGFNTGNVSLACSVGSTVSLAPLCKVGAISGGKSTLTVSTTPVMSGSLKRSPLSPSAPFYAMFLPISGMAFLGAGIGASSRKKKLLGLLLLCLMLSGLVFMAACGGGSTSGGGGGGGGGTPAGNYTITVTGTALGLSPTAPVTLTVQ